MQNVHVYFMLINNFNKYGLVVIWHCSDTVHRTLSDSVTHPGMG